ncbi:MAG: Cys-tRNA(Pro) deacylase [Deltaproteobacteria bacterium]|nr:Cys-tRNA(Pro) deacylase [Candidatus Anaeroferrophillus wilburensis]MBN2888236.1 Cys-tRNA(Pro) deacylase [Deltaproteobacteria bacterium]
MAKTANIPSSPAIRMLQQHQAAFELQPYAYEDHGGTAVAARELGVDEHQVIKTLVMEDENHQPLLILMHGDQEVSTKALAREINVKSITPCQPAAATRHTGYQVGGISPFGTRKALPVYMEESIVRLPYIYINGGRRGLLVKILPADLINLLKPIAVQAAR